MILKHLLCLALFFLINKIFYIKRCKYDKLFKFKSLTSNYHLSLVLWKHHVRFNPNSKKPGKPRTPVNVLTPFLPKMPQPNTQSVSRRDSDLTLTPTHFTLQLPEPEFGVFFFTLDSRKWCDGKIDCPPEGADELRERCPQRFYCAAAAGGVSIPHENVCDGVVDCLKAEDEFGEACRKTRHFCPVLGSTKVG